MTHLRNCPKRSQPGGPLTLAIPCQCEQAHGGVPLGLGLDGHIYQPDPDPLPAYPPMPTGEFPTNRREASRGELGAPLAGFSEWVIPTQPDPPAPAPEAPSVDYGGGGAFDGGGAGRGF